MGKTQTGTRDKDPVNGVVVSDLKRSIAHAVGRDSRDGIVIILIERTEYWHLKTLGFNITADELIDFVRVRREHADPPAAGSLECGKGCCDWRCSFSLRARSVNQFKHSFFANDHGGRSTAIGDDIQRHAREDHIGSVGDVRFHRTQVFGRDRWRVRNPGLVDSNPRYIDYEFELVFYAVIGGKNHQSNPSPRGDTVIHCERNVRQIDETEENDAE